MKTRILGLVAALVLLIPLGQSVFAAGHGERMIARMTEKLGLTAEQESSLQTIFEEKMASKGDKYQAHSEVQSLIDAGDAEAAAELAAQQARQRVLDHAEFTSQVKAVLSQEQFEQWQAMKQNRKHRVHHKTY
ncbi:MAG: hypothetical protein KTR17_01095 [Cellvibrionaceae bacterium]|nr:hypothetical protein [Cellvibrionaceae bacterium]